MVPPRGPAVKVAAITAVKDEADIIGENLLRLLAEGVDVIRVADQMSTDGTRDVLADVRRDYPTYVEVIDNTDTLYWQAKVMTELAHDVGRAGADWVLPFDADEFVYATNPSLTIAQALSACASTVVSMRPYLMLDRISLVVGSENRLPKVAFRFTEGCRLLTGNHSVVGVYGSETMAALDLRELKFRSFDHFCRKVANYQATEDSFPPDTYYRTLDGFSPAEMEAEWQTYLAQPTIISPIPPAARRW